MEEEESYSSVRPEMFFEKQKKSVPKVTQEEANVV
jgi:hypothetical protein